VDEHFATLAPAELELRAGALFTTSYYGGEKVIEHPVKAALGGAVGYLAYELGPKGIRVHAISLGPVKTRAASGLDHFDDLLQRAAERAPARQLVSIEDVGVATAVLATDYAKLITGETVYVDGGYHILG
jgi:enoyl-[acyl-carrier protein] reductase I